MSNKALKKLAKKNRNRADNEVVQLPDIKDIYPHKVKFLDNGDKYVLGLNIIKWLESNGIMVNQDFFFDTMKEKNNGKIAFRFRKKKHRDFLKENKEAASTPASSDEN